MRSSQQISAVGFRRLRSRQALVTRSAWILRLTSHLPFAVANCSPIIRTGNVNIARAAPTALISGNIRATGSVVVPASLFSLPGTSPLPNYSIKGSACDCYFQANFRARAPLTQALGPLSRFDYLPHSARPPSIAFVTQLSSQTFLDCFAVSPRWQRTFRPPPVQASNSSVPAAPASPAPPN